MIAVDTSSLISYIQGDEGKDVALIDKALEDGLIVIPPPVLSEILSEIDLPIKHEGFLKKLPTLLEKQGFWERTGHLRRSVLKKKLKAHLADALICQYCLDYNLPLITRDNDFKNFAEVSKLIII
jgi:predicted nucleic acid-binding protein